MRSCDWSSFVCSSDLYLFGTLALFAGIDWRLLLPVVVWTVGYAAVIYTMVPPVRSRSAAVPESNSALTGRVVDSYTNIQSVKLFAHAEREAAFVAEVTGLHNRTLPNLIRALLLLTVTLPGLKPEMILARHGLAVLQWIDSYTNIQSVKLFAHAEREDAFVAEVIGRHTRTLRNLMRAIFLMTVTLTVLNTALILAVTGLAVLLWIDGGISVGAIAVAIGLIIRLTQMSGWILRTVTSLFENIGTVQNGIDTISQGYTVTDKSDAKELEVATGEVRFEEIGFHYGQEGGIIDHLSLTIRPGEKVGIVGRSGAGKSTLVNLLLRFYDLASGDRKSTRLNSSN